ncbi:MAG: AsmA family protein [Hyphomonadaceae bacterium]
MATAFILFLTFADWNALKGPISSFASSATGRHIVIEGDLDINPWHAAPRVSVGGLSIGNPSRFRERGEFARVGQAEAAVRWLPLFVGRIEFVRLNLQDAEVSLYRNAQGVSNWAPNASSGRPFNMPAIREFALSGGRVRLEDEKRRMTLDAEFTTEESKDADNPGQFQLAGEGRINRQPFTLDLTGAPLLNVRRDRPYPFRADVRAGATHILANGAIRRPFDFNDWYANVEATGNDLADLYEFTGLALPNTPPYDLDGRIERDGVTYGMREISGRVGDSDLRGAFTATRQRNGRLMLEGDFRSNSLDFDDLMAVLGGAPSTGRGETASPEQRQMAANLAAQERFLPDAQLDISRVRNMDARVSYRAARVRSERIPLRGLSVDIGLDNGLLRLDPLTLDLRQGRIGGAVALNARSDVPRADIDVRLTNARIENILAISGSPPISGALLGRARLSGSGGSVRDVAANATGTITLVSPRGEIREAFAELTGINVTRGLGLLLSDDDSEIGVRCAVASFRVNDGIARARSMVFDTETMLIQGEGTISLRNETFDLRLQGEPKEPRLIRIAAPITVQGRWRAPEIGIEAGDAGGQAGLAALLASLVAPLAGILPFVDAGLAEDANCSALLAGRQQQTSEG